MTRLCLLLFCLLFVVTAGLYAEEHPIVKLTVAEQSWLRQNAEKLNLVFNVEFPPIEFISTNGNFIGIGADVISLVEKQLGVIFPKIPSDDWNQHLNALESGACAIAPTIVRTPERERFAFFTSPYATVPVVIIGTRDARAGITLDDLAGKKVAVVSGYATEEYLRKRSNGHLEITPVADVAEGLRITSFGQVDAYVENLAVAAYYIDQEGIPNLRVIGSTDYTFTWCIGVSRKYPLLFSAIQKALDTIPESELEMIRKRWISLQVHTGMAPEAVQLLKLAAIFVILLLAGLSGIAYFLKRRLNQQVEDLRRSQQSLLDQAALLKLATEATQAGIWEFDPSTRLVFLSTQWFKMLGYPETNKEIDFHAFKAYVHPEDFSNVTRSLEACSLDCGQALFELEFRLRRADGAWCWVLSKGRATRPGEKGDATRVVGLDINIQNIKETQLRMVQSEAKFRAVFDHAPYAIAINSLDGRYLDANPALLESRNIEKAELVKHKALDFAELASDEVKSIVDALMEKGFVRNLETTVRKKDGTIAHALFSSALVDIQGEKQILSMVVDVTERKNAEKALKESESRFRALFQMAPLPLVEIMRDGTTLALNDRFQETLGYTLDDIPTLAHWWEKAYPDPVYRRQVIIMWRNAVESSEISTADVQSGEFHVTCKDGTLRDMVIGASVIGDRLLVSLFDITERKQEEAARMESLELLRATFNATSDGILVVNKELKVTQANRQFYEMWRIPGDLRKTDDDRKLRAFVEDQLSDIEGFRNMVDALYHSQEQALYEIPFKDGRVFECYSAPMVVENNEIGRVWDFRDISERKWAETEREKLQEQLLQAQKLEAVGILAGGVAHDFNNMLGAIIGYAELTMEQMDAENPFRKNLARILDAAQRSAALTRQLLTFARKQSVTPMVLDLNASVETMLKMLRRLIGENIDLAWLPAKSRCRVRMDPSQLDQVLANLCVNARDAIADVGKITISTDTVLFDETSSDTNVDCVPGEYVQLAVSDTGCGMDKDTMAHVFEPFFTTKGLGRGTGLGLATLYGIVRQNDGFINLYSEPGAGTTFKIYLPRHLSEDETETSETVADIPRSRGETILLVEDDPTLLEMGQMMLQRLGYDVLSTDRAAEALQLVEAADREIHMFITDVVMPEMNGRELADRLLAIRPGMKHIFMSGYTADVIVHQGVLDEQGIFIQKPFTIKDIAFKIRSVLDAG